MNLKIRLKQAFSDKYLYPLRRQVEGLVRHNSTIIDIGCGHGKFLFEAENRISYGVGIDINRKCIRYANDKKKTNNIIKLDFIHSEAYDYLSVMERKYDLAVCMLCLHEMSLRKAVLLLKLLSYKSKQLIIVDINHRINLKNRIAILFDEMLSFNYFNFRKYMNFGGVPTIIKVIEHSSVKDINSVVSIFNIWKINF